MCICVSARAQSPDSFSYRVSFVFISWVSACVLRFSLLPPHTVNYSSYSSPTSSDCIGSFREWCATNDALVHDIAKRKTLADYEKLKA